MRKIKHKIRFCKQNWLFLKILKTKFYLTTIKNGIWNARRNWHQLNILHLFPSLLSSPDRPQPLLWLITEPSVPGSEERGRRRSVRCVCVTPQNGETLLPGRVTFWIFMAEVWEILSFNMYSMTFRFSYLPIFVNVPSVWQRY